MKKEEYEEQRKVTENIEHDAVQKRLKVRQVRLLHAAIGIATEGGELLDALKRHLYYGEDLDELNVLEELGDLLWYLCLGLDAIDENLDSCMKANVRKLGARYKYKTFDAEKAVKRDTKKERVVLSEKDAKEVFDFAMRRSEEIKSGCEARNAVCHQCGCAYIVCCKEGVEPKCPGCPECGCAVDQILAEKAGELSKMIHSSMTAKKDEE